jgi:hypothetical protein
MYLDNWRLGGTDWMDLDLVGQQSRALVALFRLCRLRTIRCMDPGQVTDLLSWAYTCLWGREDLFLSCHGFWLFLDRLFRVVIYIGLRRSKHHTKARPAVLGAYSPSLDGDLDPLTGVERVGLACARGTSKACVFGAPSLAYWFTNHRFCMTVRLDYALAS